MSQLAIAEVYEAADQLRPYSRVTPVWELERGFQEAVRTGPAAVSLKLECLQHAGSFKARGAQLGVLRLTERECERGVVAMSAGNHAIAVSFVGRRFGVPVRVVMPETANPLRVERCRQLGAEVQFCRSMAEGFAMVEAIAQAESRTILHPFESQTMVLGAATLALEWLTQDSRIDALIVPVGGGGLIAGIALAAKQIQPQCQVFGVEPFGADSMFRSFQAGTPQSIDRPETIADTLGAPFALPYSFGICRTYVDEVVRVSDDELCGALYRLSQLAKLAVEPAGAAALAACLGPLRDRLVARRVGLLVCGANIDAGRYSEYLLRGEQIVRQGA